MKNRRKIEVLAEEYSLKSRSRSLWLQNITTQEPDNGQLEVAIKALKESLKLEPNDAEHAPVYERELEVVV